MPATIFNGSKVKALKDTLSLNGGAEVISTTSDPSSGGGLAAPIGSIALNTSAGTIYQKTGAGDTAWGLVSSAGSLPVTGGTMTGDITYTTGTGALTNAGVVVGNFLTQMIFTSGTAATYTPTDGTRLIVVELQGGGGGGAGIDVSGATMIALGGGGGGGGYQRFLFRDISGLTGTYTVGAGGAGGAATGASGSAGGTTSFTMDGYTRTAAGGAGGTEGAEGVYTVVSTSAAGGSVGSSGTVSSKFTAILTRVGQASHEGIAFWSRSGDDTTTNSVAIGGIGGSAAYGLPMNPIRVESTSGVDTGESGATFGSGGNGARVFKNTAGAAGGSGVNGYIIITEYS